LKRKSDDSTSSIGIPHFFVKTISFIFYFAKPPVLRLFQVPALLMLKNDNNSSIRLAMATSAPPARSPDIRNGRVSIRSSIHLPACKGGKSMVIAVI
jgi:hypothetical protein